MAYVSGKSNLGILRLTATNQALDYQPFEVSSCTLGIISSVTLREHDYLVLEQAALRIPLRVFDEHSRKVSPQSPKRYRLMCLDHKVQLDKICLQRQSAGQNLEFQYARFALNPRLYIEAQHLVTHTSRLLETVNISRSGLLLKTQGAGQSLQEFPMHSQIGLSLDVAHLWLAATIHAKGQIVRAYLEKDGGHTAGFLGVQLLSFSNQDQPIWNELMSRLERAEISGSECVRAAYDPPK